MLALKSVILLLAVFGEVYAASICDSPLLATILTLVAMMTSLDAMVGILMLAMSAWVG